MANGKAPRVVAVANQKGGVGKTTTAVNLAAAMAERGYRVLLLDLDPQGNASTAVGLNSADRGQGIYQVLSGDCGLAEAIVGTAVPGLFLLPSTQDLAAAEIEFSSLPKREYRLKEILTQVSDVAADAGLDLVLIDCPPALGLLTVNALTAADGVLRNWTDDYDYMTEQLDWGVITYTFHPFVSGRGHRMKMMQGLIEHLASRGAVFLAMEEAAAEARTRLAAGA